MVTEQQIAGWRNIAEAATPGPWSVDESPYNFAVFAPHPVESGGTCIAVIDGGLSNDSRHDAAFIAASRTAVPALLAERDALAAEVQQLRAQLAGERALMNMVPGYVQYLAKWRVGDGSFLLFNEWVNQQIDDTPAPAAPPTAEELAQEAAYYAALAAQQQREHATDALMAQLREAVAGDVDDDGGYCGPTCGSIGAGNRRDHHPQP